MDKQLIEVASLGRTFTLGMLYNRCDESLCTGFSLWDHDQLQKNIGERPQYNSQFEIIASESKEDKSSALNVDASLELNVLLGLIKAEGSAKYLVDCKKSKNQARVTLKYEVTTKFQQLSMDHLGPKNVKYWDIITKSNATHVVTGILYGARAFFVFDREVSENEDYSEIQGNLTSMINLLVASLKCDASLGIKGQDISADDKFSCKFIGDFALEKNPVTYQDAVQVYRSLPQLLGPSKENVVPLKVWLLPLTYFDASFSKVIPDISTELVHKVKCVLEDLTDLEVRCNDALNTNIAQQFPEINQNLQTFKRCCCDFKKDFLQAMAEKYTTSQRGDAAEYEEIFTKFDTKELTKWLDWEEKEIYFLKSLINMENIKNVFSEQELDVEALNADHAICFAFTSLLTDDLEQILKAATPQDPDLDRGSAFSSALRVLGSTAKLFADFAEANKTNNQMRFLTAGLAGERKGARIQLYRDGRLVNEDFKPPSKPETLTEGGVSHNSVTLSIGPSQSGTESIIRYSVEHSVSGENMWTSMRADAGEVTVSGLTPNTEYIFRCRAVTSVGVGPARETGGSIKTLTFEKFVVSPVVPVLRSEPGSENPLKTVKPDDKLCPQCSGARTKKTITVDACTTCDLPQESLRLLEDFTKLELRCSEAMKSVAAQQFSEISKNLKMLIDLCSKFKLDVYHTLKKTEFSDVIHSLSEWMEYQEKEIQTLMFITKDLNNMRSVRSENDVKLEAQTTKTVACFMSTLDGRFGSYLSRVSRCLNDEARGDVPPLLSSEDKEPWFYSQEHLDSMSLKAKLFSDFAEANKDNEDMKFLTLGLVGATKGARIHLYRDGRLVNEDFKPPSKPETVTGSDLSHNSVTLSIGPVQSGTESIIRYSVESLVGGRDEWKVITCDETEPVVTVRGLTPNTEYWFRCRAVTSAGVGPAREFSQSIKTLPSSPPGNLQAKAAGTQIEVTWEKPTEVGHNVQILNYVIEFTKTESSGALHWKHTVSTSETGLISGLQPHTEYSVRVRCDCGGTGRSKRSNPVNVCTTRSLTELLISSCQCVRSAPPSVYQLPLTEEPNTAGHRMYSLGTGTQKSNRTMMLLGATGTGKSTLINTMINYILGVERSDDFRFTLIKEEQTSEVTVYKLHHQEGFKIPFSLTVVDTPGFVTKEGDKLLRQQLRRLFASDNGVCEIDAVCVVAASQKDACNSLFSIFGKDVLENIRVLVTFADGKRSSVVETINSVCVPCQQGETNKPTDHFKFNSSALFECKCSGSEPVEEDDSINEVFWSINVKNWKRFFADLGQMTTKTLVLTEEVLQLREELEDAVDKLQTLKQGSIKQECETELTRAQNLEVGVFLGGGFLTHLQCHFVDMGQCFSQGSDRGPRPEHVSHDMGGEQAAAEPNERFLLSGRKTIRVLLKKKFKARPVQDEMRSLMEMIQRCLNRLAEIALKPLPRSISEYIHTLIEREQCEARPGWIGRVHALEVLLAQVRREELQSPQSTSQK
ncbi:uncharacterized protein LOC114854259 [Betta splendens]|uniref:Uncharacterized protein LOC114854259 n=1 Tax=Betta splendens TaxID=158456 RepID=A0A6P7MDA4_BETSP|nr:uncharacterized protein LOC114854259 [Betta splendens]